jgi:hypothetical protein
MTVSRLDNVSADPQDGTLITDGSQQRCHIGSRNCIKATHQQLKRRSHPSYPQPTASASSDKRCWWQWPAPRLKKHGQNVSAFRCGHLKIPTSGQPDPAPVLITLCHGYEPSFGGDSSRRRATAMRKIVRRKGSSIALEACQFIPYSQRGFTLWLALIRHVQQSISSSTRRRRSVVMRV